MTDIRERAARIKLAIFDVDGVLTDGQLYFDDNGFEYKGFHSRDGLGISLLLKNGIEVAVISGRSSKSVARRMADLGVNLVFQGQHNKLEAFDELCRRLRLEPEQIAHVGDDLPDLPIMRRVGLAIAVADAHASIVPFAHWQTKSEGGRGAAREVCDLVLGAQDKLQAIMESHY